MTAFRNRLVYNHVRLPSPRSGTRFLTSLLLMTIFCNSLIYKPLRFLTSFGIDNGALYRLGREAGAFRKSFGRVRKIPAKRSCFPPPLDIKIPCQFRMKPNLSLRRFGEMRNRVPLLRDELTEGNLPAVPHLFL